MIEDDNFKVLYLCSILNKLKHADTKYLRAQYRVSYYRKVRKAILEKEPSVFLKRKNLKWKNNLKELNKKIEEARLTTFKLFEYKEQLKSKLWKPLKKALKEVNANLHFDSGRIVGFSIGKAFESRTITNAEDFARLADQYDAQVTLNKVLSREVK